MCKGTTFNSKFKINEFKIEIPEFFRAKQASTSLVSVFWGYGYTFLFRTGSIFSFPWEKKFFLLGGIYVSDFETYISDSETCVANFGICVADSET